MKWFLAFAISVLCASHALAQQGPDNDPAAAQGYVNNYFHHTSFDSINQFNGALTVPIPIGPAYQIGPKLSFQATLTYNTRITEPGRPTDESQRNYFPIIGDPALGIGWNFTPGKIACGALATSTTPDRPCFIRADGAEIDFFTAGGNLYTTSDATQYQLLRTGSPATSFTLTDGDGNQYVFDWVVKGYDDDATQPTPYPGYVRDYGRGRDGFYLTSITDPFGNKLTIGYQADGINPCPFTCSNGTSMTCTAVAPNPPTKSWVPATFTIQRVGDSASLVGQVTTDPTTKQIKTLSFKTFANGASQLSNWGLEYSMAQLANRDPTLYCETTPTNGTVLNLPVMSALRLPSDIAGTSGYQFSYFTSNFAQGYLQQMLLPTSAAVYYDYGNYHFYRGRKALLDVDNSQCQLQAPPASQIVIRSQRYTCGGVEGCPSPDYYQAANTFFGNPPCLPGSASKQYTQSQIGVLRRWVRGTNMADQITDYTQYSFPYGENANTPPTGAGASRAQSLTVALHPADVNGNRVAETTLFWSGNEFVYPDFPSNPGDETGADIRHAVYQCPQGVSNYLCDPAKLLLDAPTAPVCGSAFDSLCPSYALRVSQHAFDYSGGGANPANRRLLSETTYYGPVAIVEPTASDYCQSPPTTNCVKHNTAFSLSGANTWEGNGRHYNIEAHSDNFGNPIQPLVATRQITTTWTPWGSRYLPNLFSERLEVDQTIPNAVNPLDVRNKVDRFFTFDLATGFLNASWTWDDPAKRLLAECRESNTAGNVLHSITETDATKTTAPTSNPCPATTLAAWPANKIGIDGDAFAQEMGYAGGRVATKKWLKDKTLLSWFASRVARDTSTGWITDSYDTASQQSSFKYDSLGRVTQITPPAESPTFVCYDSPTRTTVYRAPSIAASCPTGGASGNIQTWQQYTYDTLGQVLREIKQMPVGWAAREHQYDAAGNATLTSEWVGCSNLTSTSAPTGCLQNIDVTTTTSDFDPFGRPQTIRKADGSTTTIAYLDGSAIFSDTAKAVTITNINGLCTSNSAPTPCSGGIPTATTSFKYDAFGRLKSVTEPDAAVTSYDYNAANKLVKVSQSGQYRYFNLDAFGFTFTEVTPEAGTVDYRAASGLTNFGSIGNLLGKKEGSGVDLVTSAYTYDPAGRLAIQTANGTRFLMNCYDGSGASNCPDGSANFAGGTSPTGKLTRRIGSNPPVSSDITDDFTYSGLGGRLSKLSTTIPGGTPILGQVDQTWAYNNLGLVAQHNHARPTSPSLSPFVESTTYTMGLPTLIYANGFPVVSGITYWPSGAVGGYSAGPISNQQLVTTIAQDDLSGMARPGRIFASSNIGGVTGPPIFDTNFYNYDGAGNIVDMGFDVFTYDARSRLTAAALSVGGSQFYCYDTYGNRVSLNTTTASCAGTVWSDNRVPPATNYDLRGNMKVGIGESYTYDALNRITTVSPSNYGYIYDGGSERVVKVPPSSGQWTYTLRDEAHRVSTEIAGSSPPAVLRDNIFLGHFLVASYAKGDVAGNGPAWTLYSSDHLGTPRLLTDLSTAYVESRRNWPFGDQVISASPSQHIRFAGMEQDPEGGTGNDRYNDHARHHAASLGRFLSPDKLSGHVESPQSWNRYAYAHNDPIHLIDPDGLAVEASEIRLLWSRLTHFIERHISKDVEQGASKFITNDPRRAQKLIEQTVRPENLVGVERLANHEGRGGVRKIYEKQFNKTIGTEGETVVRAVTEPKGGNVEKFIAGFPVLNSIAEIIVGLIPGMTAYQAVETGVDVGVAGAEKLQQLGQEGNITELKRREAEMAEDTELVFKKVPND